MYKKISSNEKIARKISEVHSADNISLAVTKLNGKLDSNKITNERVYYFISADVNFIIDDEKVHCNNGDVLYLAKNTIYSAEGDFEAITINIPAFGVIK